MAAAGWVCSRPSPRLQSRWPRGSTPSLVLPQTQLQPAQQRRSSPAGTAAASSAAACAACCTRERRSAVHCPVASATCRPPASEAQPALQLPCAAPLSLGDRRCGCQHRGEKVQKRQSAPYNHRLRHAAADAFQLALWQAWLTGAAADSAVEWPHQQLSYLRPECLEAAVAAAFSKGAGGLLRQTRSWDAGWFIVWSRRVCTFAHAGVFGAVLKYSMHTIEGCTFQSFCCSRCRLLPAGHCFGTDVALLYVQYHRMCALRSNLQQLILMKTKVLISLRHLRHASGLGGSDAQMRSIWQGVRGIAHNGSSLSLQ